MRAYEDAGHYIIGEHIWQRAWLIVDASHLTHLDAVGKVFFNYQLENPVLCQYRDIEAAKEDLREAFCAEEVGW